MRTLGLASEVDMDAANVGTVMSLKNCCHLMSNDAIIRVFVLYAYAGVKLLIFRVFKLNWNQFFLK
jgi:hypothetical protein